MTADRVEVLMREHTEVRLPSFKSMKEKDQMDTYLSRFKEHICMTTNRVHLTE